MHDLIERDALKNHLYRAQAQAFKCGEWYIAGAIQSFIILLDTQPAVDVETVRNGVWTDNREKVVCSICKSEFNYEMLIFIANGIEAEYVDGMTCRCPKCGSYNRYGEPHESEVQSDDER